MERKNEEVWWGRAVMVTGMEGDRDGRRESEGWRRERGKSEGGGGKEDEVG